MKIYQGFEKTDPALYRKGSVATVGTFDGVHLAHREILHTLTAKAREMGVPSAVVTFHPHPRAFFRPDQPVHLLSDDTEKALLLEQAGVDILVVQPFTRQFAALSAEEFLREDLIARLGVKALVSGYDHSFGKEKQNAYQFLRQVESQYHIEALLVSRMEYNGITISSSSVRRAVEGGDVALAGHLLGRPYSLRGEVVHGKQLGRTIGFPTANIRLENPSKLLPPDGVYAVRTHLDGETFDGMMNIGWRPTVDDYPARSIEVNIFDFDRDIYGRTLTVEIAAWIRSEVKFSSIDALKAQLGTDGEKCRRILSEHR